MISIAIGVVIGYVIGCAHGVFVMWRVWRRMSKRIVTHGRLEYEVIALERQRRARDFDVDELPREGAGPEAEIGNLFGVRPGALENSRKSVD